MPRIRRCRYMLPCDTPTAQLAGSGLAKFIGKAASPIADYSSLMKATQSVRNEVPGAQWTKSSEPFESAQNPRIVSKRTGTRSAAILWVRMQMVRNGISYEDLVQAGCFDDGTASKAARFRSADGRTWDGQGQMPDWLQRAVNAGQSIEHFRID